VQALAARPVPPRLWLVTRGALSAAGAPSLVQAPLAGLARVVSLEHPELRCTLVDLDPANSDLKALVAELAAEDGEPQVARRAEDRLLGRLARHRPGPPVTLTLRPDAGYLVTGGFGALGLEVARWLVAHGARRVALLTRSGPSPQALPVLDELRRTGATVLDTRADVTRAEEIERAVAELGAPLAGVVHAAGALGDAALLRLLPAQLEEAMAAKALGALNLHHLTATRKLDFFVLFSSVTALLGRPGQGAYAAANAFVDALAHQRHARGLPALAVNWGPWSAGMAAGGPLPEGLHALGASDAFAALERLLTERVAQAAVVAADWVRFARPGAARVPSLLNGLIGPSPSGRDASAGALRRRLAAAPPAQRRALLQEHVLAQVRAVLQMDASQPFDARQPLSTMGFDSLMAVELSRALGQALERPLPATLLFQHPTVEALVEHLVAERKEPGAAGDDIAADADDAVGDATLRREVAALDEAQLDAILSDFAGTD